MDTAYRKLNLEFKNSLFLLTQIISVNSRQIIVDGGMKSISVDQAAPVFRDYPGVPLKLTEEHTSMPNPGGLKIQDRLMMIPSHCCTAINLHDFIYLIKNDKVIDRIPVTSRGKSR
jgi:D-serine deaminase-like pyridoxal phosphate-dependent protein